MPSKSESSDAQFGKPESPRPSLLLLSKPGGEPAAPRGLLLSYCELSMRQGDAPTAATIRRFTARPGCSCWLLFAVIPPPCSQKARISAAYVNPFAVFSVHISENSGSGSGGELR